MTALCSKIETVIWRKRHKYDAMTFTIFQVLNEVLHLVFFCHGAREQTTLTDVQTVLNAEGRLD